MEAAREERGLKLTLFSKQINERPSQMKRIYMKASVRGALGFRFWT